MDKKDANDIIAHGGIQIIDYSRYNGYPCAVCEKPSAHTLSVGEVTINLCYECLGDLGHCIIDGLL